MSTIIVLLLGALCVVPACADECSSDTVRVQTRDGKVIVSVKDGPVWKPILASAASRGGARLNTLAFDYSTSTAGTMELYATHRGTGIVQTFLSPGLDRLHVDVAVNVDPRHTVDLEAIDAGWNYLGGKPDFTWTPNLTPNPDEVVGRHVFRSPAVVVQRGGLAAVLLPELDTMNGMPLPATLGLDVRDPDGPRLDLDFRDHDVVRHVFWRHQAGKTKHLEGAHYYRFSYDILLAANAEPRRAYRLATRWWAHTLSGNLHDTLPQSVPWSRYAAVGFDQYMLPIAWRQTAMDGETVGGVSMNSWGYENATWFQCWFNDLRSAYGTYLWGKRLKRDDLVAKARQTRQLLLHSPQKNGLFPVIYDWDRGAWHDFEAGGGPGICHVVDCAWAAYWLLMWDRDLEKDPASIAFARRLGDYLVSAQKPDGNLPAYVTTATMQPTESLAGGAESAGCGMFLAFLGRQTGEAKYLDAARKVAEYLRRDIMPRNKWFDYETFYSCSGKPETFYDSITDQNPQNNLSIQWAAELFRQLYLAGHKPADLKDGEALMDYLNLYQQCWSPPWMTFEGFGGYGVQNTDAEWNDARQAQFACTNLDYYELTGKREYMERGIAALRAGFATTYMPENALISPYTYAKTPTGYADENYGHGGTNGPAGPTSWDWGTGSALASVAYAHQTYGDVWVDWDKMQAFGIDGVTAALEPTGTQSSLKISSGVRTLEDVSVRGKGTANATITVDGTPMALNASDWRNGFLVSPKPAGSVHHLPPIALAADDAAITFEVWPLKSSAAPTVVSTIGEAGGHLSDSKLLHVHKLSDGVFEARWDATAFKPGTQMLQYQFNDKKGCLLGPFRVPVVGFGKETPSWSDAFAGPDLENGWESVTPGSGQTVAVSNGLILAVPGDRACDFWVGVENAPRVLRPVPAEGWSFSVTMPASTRTGDWQSGITVALPNGGFAFFGPHSGRAIVLETSGQNGLASFPLPTDHSKPVTLRVRWTGGALWFDWRAGNGVWSRITMVASEAPPTKAGVFLKTWEPLSISAAFTEARMATLK
jgi:hypothetical protein